MAETSDVLNNIRIASPCQISWEDMEGDERVRFCSQCKLNVYNIAGMDRAEAEALMALREGEMCLRLYRRADGTVLTRDCPEGLFVVRRRLAVLGIGMACILALLPLAVILLEPLRGFGPVRALLDAVRRPRDVYVTMGTRITSTS